MTQAIGPKGEAEIAGKFLITNRGTVLQLKEGWAGQFAVGDILQRGNRRSLVTALEFLDDLPVRQSWICVLIEDGALAAEINEGDIVQFFDPPASNS